MVAQAKGQLQTKMREASSGYATARQYVESLHRSGKLTEECLLELARDGKFDEVTIAMSLICELPIGHIERAIVHDQVDHLLVLARAANLSWETAKAILLMRSPIDHSASELEAHSVKFTKLQPRTAISAMQFYRLRARAEAQLETMKRKLMRRTIAEGDQEDPLPPNSAGLCWANREFVRHPGRLM